MSTTDQELTHPDHERLAAFRQKLENYKVLEEREACEDSLSEFFRAAWPSLDGSEYVDSWAIDAMCDHLEAVVMGHIRRLLINVPPRCSKTSLCSIAFPVWVWARSNISYLSGPQVRFLCASYGHTLALDASTKSRRLITSPWFQKHWPGRIVFTEDQNTKSSFANTSGGQRQTTSVGGSLLGMGGDILIADDLNNTETEKLVETEAERLQVESFWKEFSSTRQNDPKRTATIVIQQRVHERDVSGIILDDDQNDFVHLMIPMRHDPMRHWSTVVLPQYDSEEPWEDPRDPDGEELMWPERFGEKEVRALERSLGPYMAAGRLQQLPVPKGGGIIKSDWWQLWDNAQAQSYGLEWTGNYKEFPPCELIVGSLDTAYGEKEENDFNAFTVWGIWTDKNKNRRAMLMYAWAKRVKLHGTVLKQLPGELPVVFRERQQAELGLIEWVADTCKRYKVKRLLIEDKTRGRDVAQEINRLYARENWGVQLVNPQGDKTARTHTVVSLFTDGCVWAPNTKWAQQVIDNCAIFPKGQHDDLHDTVTQFLFWCRENGLLVRGDEMSAANEEEAAYRPPQQSVATHYGV